MSPKKYQQIFETTKARLGETGYQALDDQLGEIWLSFSDPNVHQAGIPAPWAAAMALGELRHQFPLHPLAGWSLEEQLESLASILIFDRSDFFCDCDAYIDFRTDLSASDVAACYPKMPWRFD